MPRENIHQRNTGTIAVGWDRLGSVQLVVDNEVPFWYNDENLNVRDPEQGAAHTSLWADLDRDGINRLIRSLRKARDASFGKDE